MDPASNIAGLVSLAALVLEGISTLRTFCLDFKQAGSDIQDTANDLYGLQTVLGQLTTLPTANLFQPSTVTLLRRTIIDCKEDIDKWLYATNDARYSDKKGLKRVWKRLNATLDFGRRGDLRQKISSHRSQLGLVLELLGRDADHKHEQQVAALRHAQDQQHAVSMECMEAGFSKLELSQKSLSTIDDRLKCMQKTLLQAVSKRGPRPVRRMGLRPPSKRHSNRHGDQFVRDETDMAVIPSSTSKPELMRLVKTAYLVQESRGRPVIEMLAVADKRFENADEASKVSMIKYIMNMRLLVWLLRRDNFLSTARFCANDDPTSVLVDCGTLNTGYKRLVISSEFLRWKQFSLVSKIFSPLHGGSVPRDSRQIVQSYFFVNEYGVDLFRFYLGFATKTGKAMDAVEFARDSNNPRWARARQKRIALFNRYLEESATESLLPEKYAEGDNDHTSKTQTPSFTALMPKSSSMTSRSEAVETPLNLRVNLKRKATSTHSRMAKLHRFEANTGRGYEASEDLLSRSNTVDSGVDLSYDSDSSAGGDVDMDAMQLDQSSYEQDCDPACKNVDLGQSNGFTDHCPDRLDRAHTSALESLEVEALSSMPLYPTLTSCSTSRKSRVPPDKAMATNTNVQHQAAQAVRSELGETAGRGSSQNLRPHTLTPFQENQTGIQATRADDDTVNQNRIPATSTSRLSRPEDAQLLRPQLQMPIQSQAANNLFQQLRDGTHMHEQAPSQKGGGLSDYQLQLMLLEQQNKRRLLMARQEHEVVRHRAGNLPHPNNTANTSPSQRSRQEIAPATHSSHMAGEHLHAPVSFKTRQEIATAIHSSHMAGEHLHAPLSFKISGKCASCFSGQAAVAVAKMTSSSQSRIPGHSIRGVTIEERACQGTEL